METDFRFDTLEPYFDPKLNHKGGDLFRFSAPVPVILKLREYIEMDDEVQDSMIENHEIIAFCTKYPEFQVLGYLVTNDRPDTRISFEGVEGKNVSQKALNAFIKLFRTANEFTSSRKRCRAWFD